LLLEGGTNTTARFRTTTGYSIYFFPYYGTIASEFGNGTTIASFQAYPNRDAYDGYYATNSAGSSLSGTDIGFKVSPTWNQASGTAGSTALLVNTTQTALGSGTHLLMDLQAATVSKFKVTNEAAANQGVYAQLKGATAGERVRMIVTNDDNKSVVLGIGGSTLSDQAVGNSTAFIQSNNATEPSIRILGPSLYYGSTVANRYRFAEEGGSHTVDVALQREAAGVIGVVNGPIPATAFAQLALDTNEREFADTVTLTDGSATAFLDIAIADGDMMGGAIDYTITATDTTDFQSISGSLSWAAVRKAGSPSTYVCDIDEHLGTDSTAVSTGTLTDTFTCAGASDKITLNADANSSLTTPTVTMRYTAHIHTTKAITKK
jgi:hypothetical protein